MPSRESPESAIDALIGSGFSACEIDFEGGFWMDYPFAERFGAAFLLFLGPHSSPIVAAVARAKPRRPFPYSVNFVTSPSSKADRTF